MMNRHKEIKKNPLNKKNMKVFFKTQLCPNFDRGTCTRGKFCNFAHGQHELRIKPNLEKTRMCSKVQEGETCENPNCKYAHDVKELKSTKDYYKTSLCIDFKKGFCKAGELCRYAHGDEELRKRKITKREDTYSRESDYQSQNYQRRYRQDNIPPTQSHPHYYPQQGMIIGRGNHTQMLPPPHPHYGIPAYQIPPPYATTMQPPPQGYYQPPIQQHGGNNIRGVPRMGEYKNRFTQNPQIIQPGKYQMPKEMYDRSVNNNKSINDEKEIFLKKQLQQQQNLNEKNQGVFLEKVTLNKNDENNDIKEEKNFLNNKDNNNIKEKQDFFKQQQDGDNDIDYNPYYPSQQQTESQNTS